MQTYRHVARTSLRAAWLVCLGIILLGWSAVSASADSYEPETGAGPTVDVSGERYLFERINAERSQNDRETLALNDRLSALARQKAADMAAGHYFDHVSPTYGTVFDMLRDDGISYKWAGENIARVNSATGAHMAFMNSSDHRANILSAGYTHAGIGVVRLGGKVYVCQIFMKPR